MRLKIISLNLWMHVNWAGRKREIIAFLKREDPDIIVFQEVWKLADVHEKSTSGQIGEALEYPYHHYRRTMDLNSIDGTPDLPERTEGLAVLSKHPIRTEMTNLVSTPDDKFERGVLHASIKTDPPIDIFNVHFSPHETHSIKQYEETLQLAEQKGVKPIIVGDFNIFQPLVVEQRCKPEYLSCSEDHEYVSFPPSEKTLDYILIPKEYRLEHFECPDIEISDHRPIIATISTA